MLATPFSLFYHFWFLCACVIGIEGRISSILLLNAKINGVTFSSLFHVLRSATAWIWRLWFGQIIFSWKSIWGGSSFWFYCVVLRLLILLDAVFANIATFSCVPLYFSSSYFMFLKYHSVTYPTSDNHFYVSAVQG